MLSVIQTIKTMPEKKDHNEGTETKVQMKKPFVCPVDPAELNQCDSCQ